ncbi:hypothetical protein OIU81_03085 [Streptomyces sp. NBC_01454]|uniref:hypothetical protein n=1 Tax=Streptomyces sp. NBC_01454 TaxID=2975867 RepID=UPI002E37F352|nr:hypothetical protein [Streptomyces sp. NBC_01454]
MASTTDSDCIPREHTDGEPCGPCERRQAHAEGEHAFCGDECGAPQVEQSITYRVESRIGGDEWQTLGVRFHYAEQAKAERRLAEKRERLPHMQHRLIRRITTTIEEVL